MDKDDVVPINSGIFFSYKKERIPDICSNMDEPRGYHDKWNKSHKERQIPYDHIYTWNLKKNFLNKQNRNTHKIQKIK